jgi:vancomycin resistance protein YoaR
MNRRALLGLLAGAILFAASLAAALAAAPAQEVQLAAFSTSLRGRTASQRHNTRLSAIALDGAIVRPGETFSFNQRVRSWTVDRGYVKAPVSYDGELVRAFGGGVCQTSTTLYNAALLAGLPVVERNAHVFAPTYVTPGRDAAVAQYDIDLRFRNPHSWPIRVAAHLDGDRVEVRLFGRAAAAATVRVETRVLGVTPPARLTRAFDAARGGPLTRLKSAGLAGFRVRTERVFLEGGIEVRRELLSEDGYPSMNRVVAVAAEASAP